MDNTEYAPIYQSPKGETDEHLFEKAPLSEPVIEPGLRMFLAVLPACRRDFVARVDALPAESIR
jgi:hypothetical protein